LHWINPNLETAMKRKFIRSTIPWILGGLPFLGLPANAALNIYVALTLGGTVLNGDVSMATLGGVDVSAGHLECTAMVFERYTSTADPTTPKMIHGPITLRKRIDKASPLLQAAMDQNQVIVGTIKIFDVNPDSGETRHRFSYTLSQGRCISIRQYVPDNLSADTANLPPLEEVVLTYATILFEDLVAGTSVFIDTKASR